MVRTSKKVLSKIARQKLEMRQSIWPELDESQLWLRENTDGWLTVPRSMPLLLRIMDILAPKGKPISQTYLDLWCRTFDNAFVIVSKTREMAYYSGFFGERAEGTWATRMRILKELGFIDFQAGASGPMNYVLIYNPYHVIKRHHEEGKLNDMAFNALKTRAIEIRATDFEDVPEVKKPARRTRARTSK